ncbi:uncharacterized protein LOC119433628 [Dermacentor silvarum]|uniref:uncharacterized protein LOC119433628 n=1 Tax=Dermacentor silvarum TaxID=543639 RepID=UPI00189B9EF1|nr:uncharacterized protein LOC119433628 [Dermacentor silvarum]
MAWDQNLILAYTPYPLIAEKLIGELTVLCSVGLGEILHIRRLGTTNQVRPTTRKPRPPDTRASQPVTPSPATKSPPTPHPGAGTPGPSKRGLTPPGPPTERSPSKQGLPASSTSHPPPPGVQPAAQGEIAWAARTRQGPQAMEALVNRSPPLPTSTPSGPAPEAMDSAPSEQTDCTALLSPIEMRLSNLEGQMASIVTAIEDRLAAAIQTVFDRIPSMIVAQLPQIVSSTRWPTTKLKRVNKSQMQRPLPHMAEADRQPVSLTDMDMDLSALLEATQNSNPQDVGPRP